MDAIIDACALSGIGEPTYENDHVDESETRAAPALFSKTKLLSLRELKAEVKAELAVKKWDPPAAVEPATFRSGAISNSDAYRTPTKIAVELSDSPSIRAFQVTEA